MLASRARALGVNMGDAVVVITTQGTVTPGWHVAGSRASRSSGLFEIGMFEFDNSLALIDPRRCAEAIPLDGLSAVRFLKLDDMFAAPRSRACWRALCRSTLKSATGRYTHANFFRAVAIEKRVMFIISR